VVIQADCAIVHRQQAGSYKAVWCSFDCIKRQKSGIQRKPVAAFLALPHDHRPQSPGLWGFFNWHDAC
ncbi:MAG: hypothetical protein ACRESJ_20080, partial [Pseudomonas sp.]|uniref:hypothetical protein n=1 Tax=Pseudomonas sp. TaxID=306 RepID=UPI003D6FAE99